MTVVVVEVEMLSLNVDHVAPESAENCTTESVIAEPPFCVGAVHVNLTERPSGVALSDVGALGTPTIAVAVEDASLVPPLLTALTRN